MTKDNNELDVIKAYKTVEGNHARGRYNQRQIDVILHEVIPELGVDVSGNLIGIISPYRTQTEAAQEQVEGSGIEVQTVHKYQGREKENIIVTTVDNQISEFVDNPNMLNVAVSRAEKRLRVVVSGNEGNENTNIGDLVKYIKYHNFEVVDSKIHSIFDLLYKQYGQRRKWYLENKRKVSPYPSEELTHALIERILQRDEFAKLDATVSYPLKLLLKDVTLLSKAEVIYATNPLTHVDFIIFNRMDKQPVLVVETDGYAYHKKGTKQQQRDRMKDEVLSKMGIPALRLNTVESNEEKRLVYELDKALGRCDVMTIIGN